MYPSDYGSIGGNVNIIADLRLFPFVFPNDSAGPNAKILSGFLREDNRESMRNKQSFADVAANFHPIRRLKKEPANPAQMPMVLNTIEKDIAKLCITLQTIVEPLKFGFVFIMIIPLQISVHITVDLILDGLLA